MPGPLPVVFGATAGIAPHAPILTMHGRDNYIFYSAGETYKIKSHITCNIFNVIYMIQCDLCIKFAIFWGNQTPPQGPFLDIDALYFTPPGVTSKPQFQNTFSATANLFPMLLIPIETHRYESDCLRKAPKAYLIHKAKTIYTLQMNKL